MQSKRLQTEPSRETSANTNPCFCVVFSKSTFSIMWYLFRFSPFAVKIDFRNGAYGLMWSGVPVEAVLWITRVFSAVYCNPLTRDFPPILPCYSFSSFVPLHLLAARFQTLNPRTFQSLKPTNPYQCPRNTSCSLTASSLCLLNLHRLTIEAAECE
jgi:hypothetical protein